MKCKHCNNEFIANPLLQGDIVCKTCVAMNDLSFWYPILKQIQMRVPITKLVYIDDELYLERKKDDHFKEFYNEVLIKAKIIGFPLFIRTGHLSNKWDWKKSCYVESKDQLLHNIYNLCEFSAIVEFPLGIPCNWWALREIIPSKPYFQSFNGMPITREFRYFIRDGKVECFHPYWQKSVFRDNYYSPEQDVFDEMNKLTNDEMTELREMSEYIGNYFSGYWSIDYLQAIDGKWYCIDMAIGERSFHYKHE